MGKVCYIGLDIIIIVVIINNQWLQQHYLKSMNITTIIFIVIYSSQYIQPVATAGLSVPGGGSPISVVLPEASECFPLFKVCRCFGQFFLTLAEAPSLTRIPKLRWKSTQICYSQHGEIWAGTQRAATATQNVRGGSCQTEWQTVYPPMKHRSDSELGFTLKVWLLILKTLLRVFLTEPLYDSFLRQNRGCSLFWNKASTLQLKVSLLYSPYPYVSKPGWYKKKHKHTDIVMCRLVHMTMHALHILGSSRLQVLRLSSGASLLDLVQIL